MNESYWQKTSQHPCFKQLNKDIKKTDLPKKENRILHDNSAVCLAGIHVQNAETGELLAANTGRSASYLPLSGNILCLGHLSE